MLMNMRRVKWIEDDLFGLFEAIRAEVPGCNAISFSLSVSNSGKLEMTIYYHEGYDCKLLNNIEELFNVYKKRRILFQKFDRGKICG
jgi:hypothetical protein